MMPSEASCTSSLCYYNHRIFGLLWASTLGFNCLALTISMLLMGYLLAVPDENVLVWAREQLMYRRLGLPATATLLGTAAFVSSIVYTTAVFYDWPAFTAILFIFMWAIAAGFAGTLQFRYKPHKPLWQANWPAHHVTHDESTLPAVPNPAPHTVPSSPDMTIDLPPNCDASGHCATVDHNKTKTAGAQQSDRSLSMWGHASGVGSDSTHARHPLRPPAA
jgi:hypothetical protein